MWSEIGGEGHLDLMPWYIKLSCILGLAWCLVRFTVEPGGTAACLDAAAPSDGSWGFCCFASPWVGSRIIITCTKSRNDGDEDTTAAAVNINCLGTFFYHGSKRN